MVQANIFSENKLISFSRKKTDEHTCIKFKTHTLVFNLKPYALWYII